MILSMFTKLKLKNQYSHLTVMDHVRRKGMVLCKCACGYEGMFYPHRLEVGDSKSCGCMRDAGRLKADAAWRHPVYRVWRAMHARCSNVNNTNYPAYGGRGISVCSEWSADGRGEGFRQFLKDMGERPSADHSIERVNNDGPYNPSNCVWATRSQQMRNTTRTKVYTVNGFTGCLTDLARHFGIKETVMRSRVYTLGWSVERAVNYPGKPRKPKAPAQANVEPQPRG